MKSSRLRRILFIALTLAFVLRPHTGIAGTTQAMASQTGETLTAASNLALPTDQIIIKYKTAQKSSLAPAAPDQLDRLSHAAGVEIAYFREMSGDSHVLRLPEKLPLDQVRKIAARLQALAEVEYAEPDAVMVNPDVGGYSGVEPIVSGPEWVTPNDPLYANQWHYYAPSAGNYGMNAPGAWAITNGSASVIAAVIDTGITPHGDLAAKLVPGYDFITEPARARDGGGRDNNPNDQGDWNDNAANCTTQASSWHGTHVAGTIGAATNNGVGVAGVGGAVRILPVRVLGLCGGLTSDIADGMRWAAGLAVAGVPANPNPAKVLNLSLGGQSWTCPATYQDAIDQIIARGVTVVVIAQNQNTDAASITPSNCDGVITVAATNRAGARASYSNYGSVVEISAPGGETSPTTTNGILSTLNTGTTVQGSAAYQYYQGTSMAGPHVAGVVALMYAVKPSIKPAEVLQVLRNTSTAFPAGSSCNTAICGSGILNAGAALSQVSRTGSQYLVVSIYLRLVQAQAYTGVVRYHNTGVPGQTVWLYYYNGSAWSTYASTTTNASGHYQFTSLPPVGGGKYYYVSWSNDAGNSNYLTAWYCDNVTGSIEDNFTCNMEISDVALVDPPHNSTVGLPYTFEWTPRVTTSDSYWVTIWDPATDETLVESYLLGYTDSATLYSLDYTAQLYYDYGWTVYVAGPNGVGVPYYYRLVAFSDYGLYRPEDREPGAPAGFGSREPAAAPAWRPYDRGLALPSPTP